MRYYDGRQLKLWWVKSVFIYLYCIITMIPCWTLGLRTIDNILITWEAGNGDFGQLIKGINTTEYKIQIRIRNKQLFRCENSDKQTNI